MAIAKGVDRNSGREKLYIPARPVVILDAHDPVLYFLQRLRDEAHRFAISAHRSRRSANIKRSPLDNIRGIGAKRKRALLNHFGSARLVSQAGVADLEAVGGINKSMAEKIYHSFHSNE